jgi:hypothetical protein
MLTPEEARALVKRHGSQHAAADAHGVPRSTFQYWLDPEPHKARFRERYAENGERLRAEMRERYRADPEPRRARMRERWQNLSGLAYHRRLLQMRRQHALRRMAERNRRQEAI